MKTKLETTIETNQKLLLEEACQLCIKILVRREYSQKELSQKLNINGFHSDVIDDCLDFIKKENYQSDLRYAEMIINTRINQRYGLKKIKLELQQQSINPDIVNSLLNKFEDTWLENAEFLIRKKAKDKNLSDNKVLNKIKNFLLYRGYDYDTIKTAINNTKKYNSNNHE